MRWVVLRATSTRQAQWNWSLDRCWRQLEDPGIVEGWQASWEDNSIITRWRWDHVQEEGWKTRWEVHLVWSEWGQEGGRVEEWTLSWKDEGLHPERRNKWGVDLFVWEEEEEQTHRIHGLLIIFINIFIQITSYGIIPVCSLYCSNLLMAALGTYSFPPITSSINWPSSTTFSSKSTPTHSGSALLATRSLKISNGSYLSHNDPPYLHSQFHKPLFHGNNLSLPPCIALHSWWRSCWATLHRVSLSRLNRYICRWGRC